MYDVGIDELYNVGVSTSTITSYFVARFLEHCWKRFYSEKFLGESLDACRLIKHSSSRIGKPECLDFVPCEESHNETF